MIAAAPASTYGFLAFLLIAIGVNSFYFFRKARINRARRQQGFAGVTEKQAGALKRLGKSPASASAADVAEADALLRQMAWEKFEMTQEMVTAGRATSRSYCRQHERHCKFAHEPHPPGGNRNTTPPADWVP